MIVYLGRTKQTLKSLVLSRFYLTCVVEEIFLLKLFEQSLVNRTSTIRSSPYTKNQIPQT
jgi:hypothetical protein